MQNNNNKNTRQSLSKPNQKDLSVNVAMTQRLVHVIAECKKIFKMPEEMSQCWNWSYTEQELKPLTLEVLEYLSNGKLARNHHFLQDCVDNLLTEAKEKFKGWASYSTSEQAELSYKKVSRGSHLRIWRSTIKDPEEI